MLFKTQSTLRKKQKSELNEAPSEVIKKAHLEENPEGFPETKEEIIPIVKQMPVMETIVFRNERDPGIPLEFHYASATHPLKLYKLLHGEQYLLPVEVIEHLESRAVPIYSYRKGLDGHPEMFVNGYKHNFVCKPVRRTA